MPYQKSFEARHWAEAGMPNRIGVSNFAAAGVFDIQGGQVNGTLSQYS